MAMTKITITTSTRKRQGPLAIRRSGRGKAVVAVSDKAGGTEAGTAVGAIEAVVVVVRVAVAAVVPVVEAVAVVVVFVVAAAVPAAAK